MLKKTVKLTLSCGHSFLWEREVEAPVCNYCKGIREVVKVEPVTRAMLTGNANL